MRNWHEGSALHHYIIAVTKQKNQNRFCILDETYIRVVLVYIHIQPNVECGQI